MINPAPIVNVICRCFRLRKIDPLESVMTFDVSHDGLTIPTQHCLECSNIHAHLFLKVPTARTVHVQVQCGIEFIEISFFILYFPIDFDLNLRESADRLENGHFPGNVWSFMLSYGAVQQRTNDYGAVQ